MEENKPFMPPPPPHLRQTAQKPDFHAQQAEQPSLKEADMIENVLEVGAKDDTHLMLEEAQQKDKASELSVGGKKFDWNVVVNWLGFVLSLALSALFLYFLIS